MKKNFSFVPIIVIALIIGIIIFADIHETPKEKEKRLRHQQEEYEQYRDIYFDRLEEYFMEYFDDNGIMFTDNDVHDACQESYDEGYDEGRDIGYDVGYEAGEEDGYYVGYDEGYINGYYDAKEGNAPAI